LNKSIVKRFGNKPSHIIISIDMYIFTTASQIYDRHCIRSALTVFRFWLNSKKRAAAAAAAESGPAQARLPEARFFLASGSSFWLFPSASIITSKGNNNYKV
jgi:hypothetical protein